VSEEPLGLLDALVDAETALPEMEQRMESLTALTASLSALAEESTSKLAKASMASQKLALVRSFSRAWEPLTREYDEESLQFDSRIRVLNLAVETLLAHDYGAEDSDELASVAAFFESLAEMGGTAAEARPSLEGFREGVDSIAKLARDLRPGSRLLTTALNRIIADFRIVESWGEKSRVKRDTLTRPSPRVEPE
jgi:hypothetical protein